MASTERDLADRLQTLVDAGQQEEAVLAFQDAAARQMERASATQPRQGLPPDRGMSVPCRSRFLVSASGPTGAPPSVTVDKEPIEPSAPSTPRWRPVLIENSWVGK